MSREGKSSADQPVSGVPPTENASASTAGLSRLRSGRRCIGRTSSSGELIDGCVRSIDTVNRLIGRGAMYLLFVLLGVLVWSIVSKALFSPSVWTLETAQFLLVAYFTLGGPYAIQLGANVRMDLIYSAWSRQNKARIDVITVLFLVFYLVTLLIGAVSSTAYSLGYFGSEPFGFFFDLAGSIVTGGLDAAKEEMGFLERSATAWQPYLWPIKTILCLGFMLMLLQCLAELLRDIRRIGKGARDAT